jgi:hypothetical protein
MVISILEAFLTTTSNCLLEDRRGNYMNQRLAVINMKAKRTGAWYQKAQTGIMKLNWLSCVIPNIEQPTTAPFRYLLTYLLTELSPS